MFGRLIKWNIESSQFGITYIPRWAIQEQVPADFLAEFTIMEDFMKASESPKCTWKLYIDGASNDHCSGIRVVYETQKVDPYSTLWTLTSAQLTTNSSTKLYLSDLGLPETSELLLLSFSVIHSGRMLGSRGVSSERLEIGHLPYSGSTNFKSVRPLRHPFYTLREKPESQFFRKTGQHGRSTSNKTRPHWDT